ncbi:unnamed protein product [Prorocentrum cordatum]|uniref:Uncharacterized protein n=1 Tax=Prorocentrum cordatum TaxID=2364126 RepID=A0ABN9TXB6_9DINO|nr:unnamed protein product [Polarella glacialis]
MAQTTMEDIFNAGPQAGGLSSLSEGQRLAEGGPLPHLSRELPAAHYEYIDDFVIIGLDFPVVSGQVEVTTVEDIWLGAKALVVAAGFQVHKDACSEAARMIGGDFQGTRLAPNQDKMWLAVLGIQEILISRWELPDSIARIVGILSWGFLICRGALSIFSEVYAWCMEFRGGARREVPTEVLRELAAAAAIIPLVSVDDLATPWDPTVMMFDANLYGGTIISTVASVEEQRREARHAVRGGWTVWTGISSSWAADSWCEGEAFKRVGDEVEPGTRVRVPPVHACWDDITGWKEVVRWRWEEKEHTNLLEMRTGVAAARHSARSRASWGRKHLRITDSMVCLGGFRKGRSASRPILILCRRMAALDLGCGMREYWRWVPSDRNHSDGPSRGFPIGQAPKERRMDEQVLPEKVSQKIEALADVAEIDPFQPLRMGVSVPVKVLRFMHLCSGHTRAGDLEDWLIRIAAARGCLLICTNVDIGFGAKFDLTDEVNVRRLELLAETETDGLRADDARNVRLGNYTGGPGRGVPRGAGLIERTALGCYVPNVRRFLKIAQELNLRMMSREEIDDSVLCYLDRLVEDEEVGPHRGDLVVHGLAYVWPELSTGLPRSNRAHRAWHRLHVAGEGGPQPLELWAVLDEAVRLAGNTEAADAAELALDTYLGSAELFGLRAADIVIDVDAEGKQVVAINLGVAERGERTKTGMRQGVLIDRQHVAEMLVQRKMERALSDRVFNCSVDAYRRALRRACDDIGVASFLRMQLGTLDQATRGRWASEKNVLRYMKTHALVASRAALPPEVLERGAELLKKKLARAVARKAVVWDKDGGTLDLRVAATVESSRRLGGIVLTCQENIM